MRKNLTEIVFILDRSGSMSGLERDTIGGAIHHIGNIHKYVRPEDVPEHTMFVITTDGTGARGPVDLGFAPTGTEWRLPQQAGLSCHESPACRRVVCQDSCLFSIANLQLANGSSGKRKKKRF